jgi:xanthine dehydrogenase small subunit
VNGAGAAPLAAASRIGGAILAFLPSPVFHTILGREGKKAMADSVRFLLDGAVHEAAGVAPTTTVLEYLREYLRRCGTKEGCAEGDCGACTVVLATPGPDGLAYRAVNSCIQFLPTIDGTALITVEDLADADTLHPVQQAMVDCHGSQCGFCTPGFVMALFALWHADKSPTRDGIEEALAGNLCRCTGYRPIIDAAQRMYGGAPADQFDARAGEVRAQLAALARPRGLAYAHDGERFWAPQSKAELFAILAEHPDASILAGGTDFGLWVTKQHRRFAKVVWLGKVAELQTVAREGDTLMIGGAASWTAALPALAALHADLDPFLKRFASTQIRNAGTVGGNIANASPIGDGPPALLALRASVVLESAAGARTLPLDQFFLGYRKTALGTGEIVAAIRVPALAPDTRFAAYKLSKRFDQDISTVCAAFAVRLMQGKVAEARLGFGGMAAIPQRAAAAEAALVGQPWSLATVHSAMAALERDFQPLTDLRGSARYRMLAARNLLLRFYHETTEPALATRVTEAAHG